MPNPGLHPFWRMAIRSLAADYTVKEMYEDVLPRLKASVEGKGARIPKVPAARTIRQHIAGMTDEERELEGLVRWPESFESTLISWDDAPWLYRVFAEHEAPRLIVALWAVRLRRSAPDAPDEGVLLQAYLLALAQRAGDPHYEEQKRLTETAIRRGEWDLSEVTIGEIEDIEESFGFTAALLLDALWPGRHAFARQFAARVEELRKEQQKKGGAS